MRRLVASILAATAAVAGAQPITFSPTFETHLVDGTSMRRMYFHCGLSRIYFRPPRSWEVNGQPGNVTFRDSRFPDATIRIENAPAGMPEAFDDSGLDEYRKVAAGLLPAEASNVKPLSETRDAVEINDWKGFEVFYSYEGKGRPLKRSILFIKLDPDREIRAIVDARPENFEELHAALVRSLATWCEEGK